jgi:DNA-binding response OmpR family regulator
VTEETRKPLGRILLQQKAITQPELDRALAERRAGDPPLASRLIENHTISELVALKALSEQSGVPGLDLNQICIRLSDLAILPREIAVRHRILPVLVRDDRIFVAMAQPSDKRVVDELEFVTGKRVFPYIALAGPLARAITAAYEMRERGEAFFVGPSCPAEILEKAGIDAPPSRELGGVGAPPSEPPPSIRSDPPDIGQRVSRGTSRTAPSAVIVDDAIRRMAIADDLTDAGFGETGRDLSVAAAPSMLLDAGAVAKRKVLVVDDEQDIRRLLRRVFEDRGYEVIEADRGLLALRLVKEQEPDVMILDAMLPEVHGFDIARRMKGAERYAHIPIVMISAVYRGWRFAEDLKSSYGVEAYLEKPFRIGEVVRTVEDALERRTGRADVERVSKEAERLLAAGVAAYKNGNLAQAIEHLENGTRIDPLAYRLHFHLGLLYGKESRLYDAIQELETAIQMNGQHFPALKNLAVLYQKAGLRNKAIETWERALVVAPDDPTRQSIKEHLLGLL